MHSPEGRYRFDEDARSRTVPRLSASGPHGQLSRSAGGERAAQPKTTLELRANPAQQTHPRPATRARPGSTRPWPPICPNLWKPSRPGPMSTSTHARHASASASLGESHRTKNPSGSTAGPWVGDRTTTRGSASWVDKSLACPLLTWSRFNGAHQSAPECLARCRSQSRQPNTPSNPASAMAMTSTWRPTA